MSMRVIPAKAGVHLKFELDSRFRGNDSVSKENDSELKEVSS